MQLRATQHTHPDRLMTTASLTLPVFYPPFKRKTPLSQRVTEVTLTVLEFETAHTKPYQ